MRIGGILRAAAIAVTVIMVALPSPAGAHTIVTDAVPAAGQEVAGPDVEIELKLNSRIDPARSRLILTLPDGATREIPIDASASPGLLIGKATGLATGDYSLRWQVLSIDGHITRGDIPFRVK